MSRLCVDTGFLIALYGRDDHRERRVKALEFLERFDNRLNKMILAWPVMYEVMRSKLTRANQRGVRSFEELFAKLRRDEQLIFVDDSAYREQALTDAFLELQRGDHYRGLSLVDRVVRSIIGDPTSHVDGLITSDPGDFVDVCRKHRVELFICA